MNAHVHLVFEYSVEIVTLNRTEEFGANEKFAYYTRTSKTILIGLHLMFVMFYFLFSLLPLRTGEYLFE